MCSPGVRLVLVPVFLVVLFVGDGHETSWRIAAFIVFTVAVITDRFDGPWRAATEMVTEFGTLADPIADKALIGAALIGLSMLGDLPWWVTVVIMVREIGVTVLRFAVLRRGVIPASRGGKLKTLVQAVADRVVRPAAVGPVAGRRVGGDGAAIVLTVITGVDYVVSAVRDSVDDPRTHRRSDRPAPERGHRGAWTVGTAIVPGTRRRQRAQDRICGDEGEHDGGLLREVIGDVLRRARTAQGRTLREVSDSARVSLGYLSEVERGRKEASSELLGAICGALDVPLSRVLSDAGEKMARQERAAFAREMASAANIDATTKVVIPQVASMAVA